MDANSWTEVGIWGALLAVLVAAVLHMLLSSKGPKPASSPLEGGADGIDAPAAGKKGTAAQRGRAAGSKPHAHAPHHHAHHALDLNTLKGHGDAVTGIAFTADGRGLATASADRVVRVFKLEDVAAKSFKFLRINLPTGACPTAVAFAGGGASQLAVVGSDTQGAFLCLFAAAGGKAKEEAKEHGKLPPPELKWEKKAIHGGGNSVLTLGGAPATHGAGDGSTLLATCSAGTDVKLWAAADGKLLGAVDTNQLKNTMAALSTDGRFLAVAAFTADVKIWEVVYGKDASVKDVMRVMQLKGHRSAVTWLAFTWDCQRVVTASKDGTLKIWNINVRYQMDEDPKCLKTFPIQLPGAPAAPQYDLLSVSPDDRALAAAHGPLLQWVDLETGQPLDTAEQAHDGAITCLAWAPKQVETGTGPRWVLATGSTDKKVKLWVQPRLPH